MKQLEEADAIFVNKVDKLEPDELAELLVLVKERFPDADAFPLSARDNTGIEQLIAELEKEPRNRLSQMEVDYEVYAEGEAELGWMNCQVSVVANNDKIPLDELVESVVENVGNRLRDSECEVAHLKVLGQTLHSTAVANQVSSDGDAELSLASEAKVEGADLLVNARVACSPEQLEAAIAATCELLTVEFDANMQISGMQSFRPAKPEPTHRST